MTTVAPQQKSTRGTHRLPLRASRQDGPRDWFRALARDGSVDPTDKAVYAAIASFVDPKTGMSPSVTADVGSTVLPENIPTRKRLASCIGKSIFTVDRSIKRLEQRGLILVHRHTHPENTKAHAPSQYELLPYRPQPTPIPKQTATVARKRLPISATKRTRIMARDGHRCQKCGATEDLTIDHIQHWSRGGTNADDNLRVLCRSCNSQRSDGSLEGLDS